tara:strand:- start:230 stop:937 length:708 start_codon:yes stop_codon:yes gene_type:complete
MLPRGLFNLLKLQSAKAIPTTRGITTTPVKEGLESVAEKINVFPVPQRMLDRTSKDFKPFLKDVEYEKGGKYLNPVTKESLTNKNLKDATISISEDGKPNFKASPIEANIVGSPDVKGATKIKTNLFKKKAGWKWIDAPKGFEEVPTLVSVENKGKHYYALKADFPKGVNLSRYAESKSEPRLRPTMKGFVELGEPVGTISVRGKEHVVYDRIVNMKTGGMIEKNTYNYNTQRTI